MEEITQREIDFQTACKEALNIVRFEEEFSFEGQRFIIMEHMDGGDLQQILALRNYEPLPIAIAQSVTYQIGQALKFLHTRQIIHRDLKLENVMFSSKDDLSCDVKLIDFGLAEVVQKVAPAKAAMRGTIGYIAPEILDGNAYGTKSDVWSLGCLLHAMLTVKFPFEIHVLEEESKSGESV